MAKTNIKPPAFILGIKPNVIESFIKFTEESNLEELNIEEHGLKITIKRKQKEIEYPYNIIPAVKEEAVSKDQLKLSFKEKKREKAPSQKIEASPEADEKYHKIISPLVGTFYRAPAPESESFVKEGDIVGPDQTLCIIEAMKVMNKINSNKKGKIYKILIEDMQPVKQGDVLFLLEPV